MQVKYMFFIDWAKEQWLLTAGKIHAFNIFIREDQWSDTAIKVKLLMYSEITNVHTVAQFMARILTASTNHESMYVAGEIYSLVRFSCLNNFGLKVY